MCDSTISFYLLIVEDSVVKKTQHKAKETQKVCAHHFSVNVHKYLKPETTQNEWIEKCRYSALYSQNSLS